MKDIPLAHSKTPDHPDGQPLWEHLAHVSRQAALFSRDPFLSKMGELIGAYHDAGKVQEAFQQKLEGGHGFVDHATPGGKLLLQKLPLWGPVLAPPVLGHHGGLPNGSDSQRRLEEALPRELDAGFSQLLPPVPETVPRPGVKSPKTAAMELYLQIKLLHSALVDADYLDTEAYFEPGQAALRGRRPALETLWPKYQSHMADLLREAAADEEAAKINGLREQIRQDCLKAAEGPQGFYSLTVPTGGGKTLASLGFGLAHAAAHPTVRRIIYAIPFCSIIEQNAKVFRKALGQDAVLEHHSSVRPPEEGGWMDHAAENWDAPVIVTTNVQLFESLFSNRPSRCRKLHNLQDSVIILDEMQALPDGVLKPCLEMLDALVKTGGVTVVMCTATQPCYDSIWEEAPQINEILPDPGALFEKMKRTYGVRLGKLGDEALAERLRQHSQVLCIVNTRARAQNLARLLGGETNGTYHLSTMMCPQHRTAKLTEIRQRLENQQMVRIISTSLIEAGVDIDLPVVYREAAGLDSIMQAAGRCNRSGKGPLSPVYIFESDGGPAWTRRQGSRTLTEIAPLYGDLLSREALAGYFRLRFQAGEDLDQKKIAQAIQLHQRDLWFPFADISRDFEMIQSGGEPVFVPYDQKARELLNQLENAERPAALVRALRPYGVTVYANQKRELMDRGYLRQREGILWLDGSPEQLANLYTEEFGLFTEAEMPFLDV